MSKKKRKKVQYYDDGSTIADMTHVGRFNEKNPERRNRPRQKVKSTAKEKWTTYFKSVKMMVMPMLVVLAFLCIVFLILYGIGRCA